MHAHKPIYSFAVLAGAGTLLLAPSLLADEGMWTFDNPPIKQLQEKYHFTPTQQWLDHIRLSSVRLNDGGSGSFVSPHGLLLTNHHVARGQLQKNSSGEHDYICLLYTSMVTETYGGITIFEDPKKEGGLAFLSNSIAAAGDLTNVKAAIDRVSAPSILPASLLGEIGQLSAANDAWALTTCLLYTSRCV